jgi:hypothetical protein
MLIIRAVERRRGDRMASKPRRDRFSSGQSAL